MEKSLVCKVLYQSYETVLIQCPTSKAKHFDYMQNILDEHGDSLSWHYHEVFKKLKYVYYCAKKKRFWLPKSKLYSKTKCKALYKKKNFKGRLVVDHFTFFKKGYLQDIIGVSKTEEGMSGLFAPGAGIW